MLCSQSSISSSTLFCSLRSFSSSSEAIQSDLRGMYYVEGHFFLTDVHVGQYPGDFWVWLEMVTNSWMGTAGTVAGCVNVNDILFVELVLLL